MNLSETDIKAFRQYLTSCGGEILSTTSEWEILRVRVAGRTCIAYRNTKGGQRWPAELTAYWKARSQGVNLKLGNPVNQMRGNKAARLQEIGERDGWRCWYCDCELATPSETDVRLPKPTIEEICPRQIGGPTHIGNQVLACGTCNGKAGSLPVVAKVAFRDERRSRFPVDDLR